MWVGQSTAPGQQIALEVCSGACNVANQYSEAEAKPGQTTNKDGLAALLGVSSTVVDGYIRAGCPYVTKGSKGVEWKFDTAEVFRWVREFDRRGKKPTADPGKDGANKARERNAMASAELKEFELAKARGEYIHISEVGGIAADELAIVRSRLTAMSGRLAQTLSRVTDPARIEALIKVEVNEALQEITFDKQR
jgi:phage terminase Nu1 subunit (DNA packaging protein)